MFMQQDWLMRQIEMMTAAIAQLLFGKDGNGREQSEVLEQEQSALLSQKLTDLIHEGRLGKAEDLVFDALDGMDQGALALAVEFYRQANEMSDGELEAQGFTREELWEGLGEAVARYGLYFPGFWDKA